MITKGIARLLPELMKKAKGAKGVTKKGQELLSPAMQGSNRIKKHYSDAFNEARARINNMDMSPAQKDAAVEKLRTFMRNQHSEEMMRTANLGDFAVTPLPDLVKKGLLFATGGALGYGVGANKNAIVDMLKSTKLPTQVDVDFGMTPAGEIFGGGVPTAVSNALSGPGLLNAAIGETLFGGLESDNDRQQKLMEKAGITSAEVDLDEQVKFMRANGLSDEEIRLQLEELGYIDDEPLEQGGIGDLLLWNRIFGN